MPSMLIGPQWPSTQLLRETLEQSLPPTTLPVDFAISWGVEHPTALNGMRRLNAYEQLEAFAQAELPVPAHTRDVETAKQWVREGKLVFGRMLKHTRGTDIQGPGYRRSQPRGVERWNPRWLGREYWVEVIRDVAQEWRIHVFNGRSIARGLKVQSHPEETWRQLPVRNRSNGWHMTHDVDPPASVRETAKRAVAAVGYDFGGVDMLLTTNGVVYPLEVNTACGLDQYTATAYAKAMANFAKSQTGRTQSTR